MPKETIHLSDTEFARSLFAHDDDNLEIIGKAFRVKVVSRGNFIKMMGDPEGIKKARTLFDSLSKLYQQGRKIERKDILELLSEIGQDHRGEAQPTTLLPEGAIRVSSKKNLIYPKSKTQSEYLQAIEKYDVVFSIGPAGTGKTYLAMGMAVSWLLQERVHRVILTRPAVEAGESLGFLPGDLYEKLNPYLRPLYDALYEMMEVDKIQRFMERGIIEVAPLAYMRGRTLNDAFIVLDEAQNSTVEQMKMFLTRLGFNSKVVVTGDITQVDLPSHKLSGLIHAKTVLEDIRGIKIMKFSEKDVVRHPLVKKIIRAYETNWTSGKRQDAPRQAGGRAKKKPVESISSEDISAT